MADIVPNKSPRERRLEHLATRCSDCHIAVGGQHKPSCHRQGLVTEASDYTAAGLATPIEQKIERLNSLHTEIQQYKAAHPESRIGYSNCPGGILNAYREGDLTFNNAVKRLSERSGEALISQIARMTPYPDADSDPESTLNLLITQARNIKPTPKTRPDAGTFCAQLLELLQTAPEEVFTRQIDLGEYSAILVKRS